MFVLEPFQDPAVRVSGAGRNKGRISGNFSHDERVETQRSFNEVFKMIKKVGGN